jgi:hypothetical protein
MKKRHSGVAEGEFICAGQHMHLCLTAFYATYMPKIFSNFFVIITPLPKYILPPRYIYPGAKHITSKFTTSYYASVVLG